VVHILKKVCLFFIFSIVSSIRDDKVGVYKAVE
jgi:hypothetical protein